MKSGIQSIPLLILIVLSGIALAAETEPIDWKKATSLFQRSKKGETLNAEEQAYLDHAKKERQKKAQASRGDDATRGDSGRERHTGGVAISEVVSPVETLKVTASDGNEMSVVWRKPPGVGPFPTVITINGGANQQKVEGLKREALKNPIRTRLLAAGYLVVTSTFRTYRNEMQSRGPILNNLAVIEAVNKLPGVDPESVVVYGGSGGGNITLELAGETSFAAGIAGEPATIIYTGKTRKKERS
ncbi:MAG: alpha/beta hydrolase family protein [Verrucomicrobiales bacterium]